MYRNPLLVASLLFLQAVAALAEEVNTGQTYNLAEEIAELYVKSFPVASAREESSNNKQKQDRKVYEADYPMLDAGAERSILLRKIFAKGQAIQAIQSNNTVLHQDAWRELKLLYSTASAPDQHVLSRINQTVTTTGECALATLLVTPTNDIAEIRRRQEILKTLLANPTKIQAIRDTLAIYKAAEQGMLSFYSEQDPLYAGNTYQRLLKDSFYWGGLFKSFRSWNKSVGSLEFHKRFFFDFSMAASILSTGSLATVSVYAWLPKNTASMSEEDVVGLWTTRILAPPLTLFDAWLTKEVYEMYSTPIRYIAKRIGDFRYFLTTAIELNNIIKNCPELESIYGSRLTYLRKLLNEPAHTELGQIVANLQNMPLHKWSLLFNNTGRLLRTYELLEDHKEELADAIYEVGQLDAFTAIANMLQHQHESTENHKHIYVFTKLLDRKHQPKPFFKLEGMWNPLLNPAYAVGNDLTMNAAPKGIRNIILTGPNAGGKSIFLAGVTISLVLSQTFGIAPARTITITPFNRINTYINITDDVLADKSLFIAELERAQRHINILKALKEDEFSFSIFDELFSGTNPREGEAAAYAIMNYVGQYNNAFNILATHFPRIMLLGERVKDKGFANYKVYVTRKGPQNKLNYTYKVIPGKSDQAIAVDILEERGYDPTILKEAREIIEHPERYQAAF